MDILQIMINDRKMEESELDVHVDPKASDMVQYLYDGDNITTNASWENSQHPINKKIFTITTNEQVNKFSITYFRPQLAPGWLIKENGLTIIHESSNRFNSSNNNTNYEHESITYNYILNSNESVYLYGI